VATFDVRGGKEKACIVWLTPIRSISHRTVIGGERHGTLPGNLNTSGHTKLIQVLSSRKRIATSGTARKLCEAVKTPHRYKKMLFCASGDNNLQLRLSGQPGPFQTAPTPRTRPLGSAPHALLTHQASGCLVALLPDCFEVIADNGRGSRTRFDLPRGERPTCATTWHLEDHGDKLPRSVLFSDPSPTFLILNKCLLACCPENEGGCGSRMVGWVGGGGGQNVCCHVPPQAHHMHNIRPKPYSGT